MALNFDRLRGATEHDVKHWLQAAYIELPITTPAEILELLNRLVGIDDTKDETTSH